jgi:hypothetical protein
MALAMVKAPQVGNAERSRRTRSASSRNGHRVAMRAEPQARRAHMDVVSEASLDAPIVTVYRAPDGLFHHAWCHQPLEYHGRRARLEVDFFCLRCVEHVALPETVLPRIPVRVPFAQA